MVIDFLFPRMCMICGFLGSYLCLSCEKKRVPVKNDYCLYCGKSSLLGITHANCARKNGIDGVISLYEYNPAMKTIIKIFKYKGVYDAFREFFFSIHEQDILKLYTFSRLYPIAKLQPVPLHSSKFQKRGFNQSRYISRFFQHITSYKEADLIIRNKNTDAQARMKSRKSRNENIKNAFSIRPEIKRLEPDIIVLVDDVVTTGSTVGEAARVLKEAGVLKVFVFSLARD